MRTVKLHHFEYRLNKKAAQRRRPHQATLELTYRCNFNCVYCYVPREERRPDGQNAQGKAEISTKEAFLILDQLVDFGVGGIAFTGGEIFTREDLLDILIYARKKGLFISLLTNGSLISKNTLSTLLKYKIDQFQISFPATKAETFERITRAPGSYRKVLANIKMLRQKGASVSLSLCLTPINFDELLQIKAFAKNLRIGFQYTHCTVVARDKNAACERISPQEFVAAARRLRGSRPSLMPGREEIVGRRKRAFFDCLAGRTMIAINPYAQLQACQGFPFPNYDLRTGNLKQGWEEVKNFIDTARPTKGWQCKNCELWDFCMWCPAQAYLETGKINSCPEYFRQIAALAKAEFLETSKKQGRDNEAGKSHI